MRKLPVLLVLLLSLLSQSTFSKDFYGAEIRTTQSFLYGKFEVKMRSHQESGMLCSFFTFYDSPDFVSNWNEIDIEILGRYNNEVQFNTITPGNGKRAPHEKRYVLDFNPHEDFHIYGIVWAPDYIAFEIDGKEVYRDEGAHIKEMNKPQKLMMNIWSSIWTEWTGEWAPENFPMEGAYDWVKYSKYNEDGTFSLDWTDEFDALDASRWQFATHTFDGNHVQFTPNNGKFEEGILSLFLTKNALSPSKPTPAKKKIKLKLIEGKLEKVNKMSLVFSTKLDKKSVSVDDFKIEGVKIAKVKVVTDYSKETQLVYLITETEFNPEGRYSVTVSDVMSKEGVKLDNASIDVN